MREPKMAELQIEAPVATFEGDEWNEFHEHQTVEDIQNSNKNTEVGNVMNAIPAPKSVAENFVETFSGSLEDLVSSFDERITKCFNNYEEKVEKFAPVQIRSQEEIMNDCQMWWTITGNFGNLLPIDWSKTYARQLHTKVLNLREKRERSESPGLDLSDDEELAQAFDMHSLIVNSLSADDQEPIINADDVISELESLMQVSPEFIRNMYLDILKHLQLILSFDKSRQEKMKLFFNLFAPELNDFYLRKNSKRQNTKDSPNEDQDNELDEPEIPDYARVKEALLNLPSYPEEELKEMSPAALHEVLAEYEFTIKTLSETLVHELALRDELEYDKELKNQFISLLLTIQKKRRESTTDKKKRKRHSVHNMNNINNNCNSPESNGAASYLTTAIPYHTAQGAPTSEQLQIYIKILQAILDDSPQVPTLLTDYILKVLCPT